MEPRVEAMKALWPLAFLLPGSPRDHATIHHEVMRVDVAGLIAGQVQDRLCAIFGHAGPTNGRRQAQVLRQLSKLRLLVLWLKLSCSRRTAIEDRSRNSPWRY